MFEAIVSADRLRPFLDAADAAVEETRIHVEPNGLRLSCVGPSQVVMAKAMIGADAFEKYELDDDGMTFGVLLNSDDDARAGFTDVLSLAGSDELVHFEYDGTGRFTADVGGASLEITPIGTDSIRSEPDMPDLSDRFDAHVEYDESTMSRYVSTTGLVSDHVTFETDVDGQVDVTAQGDDKANVTLDAKDLNEGSSITGNGESLFSHRYLADVNSAMPSGTEVEHWIGDEIPTKFRYTFADEYGRVTFFLAPRIEK